MSTHNGLFTNSNRLFESIGGNNKVVKTITFTSDTTFGVTVEFNSVISSPNNSHYIDIDNFSISNDTTIWENANICGIDKDYRYGFNTQEKDNEVYGDKNSYTAEFWQYDARLGRRWNVDPKIMWSHSPFSCFNNNPIVFVDQRGDSAINNFKSNSSNEALKWFMSTSHGLKYIGKFAAAGQTIAGHTFKKDGKYHKKGFDLYLSDIDIGDIPGKTNVAETDKGDSYNGLLRYPKGYGPSGKLSNGRYRINVNLNTNPGQNGGDEFNEAEKKYDKKSWQYKRAYGRFIGGIASDLTHELFIHVESGVIDYLDDGVINFSHQGKLNDHDYFGKAYDNNFVVFGLDSKGEYGPTIIKIDHTNLFFYEGYFVVECIYKWLSAGMSESEIMSDFLYGIPRNKKKKK